MDIETKRMIILDNYEYPYNKTKGDGESIRARNPSCIDDITLYIKHDKSRINSLKFTGDACAITTSSTSLMVKYLENKTKEEALNIIDNYIKMIKQEEYDKDILKDLIVYDEIYKQKNRVHCALLSFKALKEYIDKEWK